ncbi:two-component regulator propeller domain-containing protein [Bacteroides sp. 519]|uniref:two-component regulator propeller domain-containing protein n=1 Tax=Bacteroides sp. 519 TaxID=2302937 RepID=UPI0013D1D3A1|nr:two-component regulator propeller domain-containing protein [Bacteroides sp. 519]NDV58247.1 response regulator [Bacteroides sp. 519]
MKRSFTVILLCLSAAIIHATESFNFRSLDVKSGIADNYIQSILCDQYGFMWFATINGLSRYDGYQFKTYTTTQLGAYNNDIDFTVEDAAGTIWIKTPKNYYYYNREKDEIDPDISNILNPLGITGDISRLFVDKDRNLWCVTGHTLYYYKFRQKELYQLTIPADRQVLQLDCYNSNAYILLSDSYIYRVEWRSQSLSKEIQIILPPGWKQRMYMDTLSRIWFYVIHTNGVSCYDTKTKQWVQFPGYADINTELITNVLDDGDGNIWIGTDSKGIYISYDKDKKVERINRDIDNPFSLPNNHISCFYKDDSDIMWVGTSKLGVAYTNLHNITFETYRLPKQEDVSCIIEDRKGNLWLGFDGEGLAYYDKSNKRYTLYSKKDGSVPSDIIVCSYLDSKGRVWFGSYGNGIFYEQNGKFTAIIPEHEQKYSISYIRCIEEDYEGNIWLGTIMDGIYCLNGAGDIESYYTMEDTELRTNSITTFSCVDGINLYIGTSSGIYYMNTQTKIISQLENKDTSHLLSESLYINYLYQDVRGLLWIGTRTGIYIYDIKTTALTHLSVKDGLSHNYIRAIIEDNENNIWITTDNGITNIVVSNTVEERSFRFFCYPYFNEDGIGNMVFNNHSIARAQQGEILMGGSGAYLSINPHSIRHIRNNHPVIFTSLYLANQRMNVGTPNSNGRVILEKNIQLLNEITMDYSDSNFALEVSSMNYADLHKLQYVYRLNENEEWIKQDGNRIYFNKLLPGKHKLEVKVYESSNTYRDNKPTSLIIHVKPPLWLSTPAYMFYILITICIIILLFRNMRQRQRHEMNEAKMRFFTNVSHDLRTPLSLIIIPLEKLLSLNIEKWIKHEIELIYRNAETLLNEVNLLLDFRQLDQEKTQLNLSYGNFSDFVRDVCNSFSPQAYKKGITFDLQINDSQLCMDFDHNKIQRVLFNLLSNAVKFNNENGNITFTLDKIRKDDSEFVRIQIADTGIGIKDENKKKVFERFYQEHQIKSTYIGSGIGLHIVKEYVELHNGDIEIKDNQLQGTIFIITLPITRNYIEGAKEENEIITEKSTTGESLTISTNTDRNSILIVEDNDDFRMFLINCLKDYYIVFEASNGKKALEILSEQSVQIVISDIMMPVMDGMELCREIKTDIRYSHIPVILLTARTASEHVVNALKEGADDYITKPFNLDILLLRIQKILAWTENNHRKFNTMDISPGEITISSLDEQLIEKAIQIVEKNMDNSEFSVSDLSESIGMSRGHLYRKLTSITGKTPIEFIHTLRIKRGKQLLEQSQMNISQISYQIGLSPKQFTKYFKDEYGCPPSEYKKGS